MSLPLRKMSKLEEIKKRKLKELMQKQGEEQQQIEEESQLQQQLSQLEAIVRPGLTKDALERYSNLKIAHQDKAAHVLVLLAQTFQSGHVKQINDEQLKELLKRLTPKKKNFEIRRI